MTVLNSEHYREWADALLCAAAAGDSVAERMYRVADWLASGGESDQRAELDRYIAWVEEMANA